MGIRSIISSLKSKVNSTKTVENTSENTEKETAATSSKITHVPDAENKINHNANTTNSTPQTPITNRKISNASEETSANNPLKSQENWSALMVAIDANQDIPQNAIDILNELNQQQFHNSFINYITSSQNINTDNLSDIIAIVDDINETLHDIGEQLDYLPLNTLQEKIHEILYSLISQLTESATINTAINKNTLSRTELSTIDSYTKYTQHKGLLDTDSVTNQCIKDSERNFSLDIILKENGKLSWQSKPEINQLFHDCYINSDMENWVSSCRNKVHNFVSSYALENKEQIENAILLEATQAGVVASSQVIKNHLKQIIKLPSENYNINVTNKFNYQLEVDVTNNKIQFKSQLICNGIQIISNSGFGKNVVATLPPIIITGNLYFNDKAPENSYYDNYTIEAL